MDTVEGTALHVGDIVVIVLYFAFVLFVGLWSSRSNRGSAEGYFLAGRNMHWLPVGSSIFVSNIGSLHFIGLAGSGAAGGIAVSLYELSACYCVLILGFFFLPVYISSGVSTMPEYLKRRYGGQRIQIYMSVLVLLNYIFTKISADLYAGAIFLEQSLQWNLYFAIGLLLAVAAIFTITGGLTAVIWTDTVQTGILFVGATALMILGFKEVGGFNNMVRKYGHAIANTTLQSNSSCGRPRSDYMHLWRDPVHSDFPWPGIIGQTVNSIWYWCSDQVIVQRALAAKDFSHAKGSTVFCGYLKLLPLFIMVFPGMIARILYTESVACSDPDVCFEICGSRSGCSNIAYPKMVLNLMPAGARGLMLAVMLSALMTSLTSIFNSSSTIFALDLWTRIRKKASELEIMVVGRVFVIFLVGISIVWIPVIKEAEGSELFLYINKISSFLQPPIAAVYLLGVLWHRITEHGAFWGLITGMSFGMARFVVEFAYPEPLCSDHVPDYRPGFIKDVHYLYFSAILFVITIVVTIIISLFTKPIDERCLQRLTWWTRHSTAPCINIDSMRSQELSSCCKRKIKESTAQELQHSEITEALADNGETSVSNVDKFDIREDVQTNPAHISFSRRAFNLICGVNETNRDKLAHRTVHSEDMLSIDETPTWRTLNTMAAAMLLVILAFVFGFFA